MLPGNGIAESSVAHSYFTTPDAGSAEFDAGVGSVLHRELNEECGRMLVTFSTISSGFLLGAIQTCGFMYVWYLSFGSSPVDGL